MPKVSVIVPIYNVEPYVEQCLRSIMQQTLTDIEILCIDDCGTDNSMGIVEKLAKEDNRIRIIKQPQNKGAGAARNEGIRQAQGEYISFIDSDDFIKETLLEKCATVLDAYKEVESVWFKYLFYDDPENPPNTANRNVKTMTPYKPQGYMALPTTAVTITADNICDFYALTWIKLYRTISIKTHNIYFTECTFGEDLAFFYHYFTLNPNSYVIDEYLYYYRLRKNSIVDQYLFYQNNIKDLFHVLSNVWNYLEIQKTITEYKVSVISRLWFNVRLIITSTTCNFDKSYSTIKQLLQEFPASNEDLKEFAPILYAIKMDLPIRRKDNKFMILLTKLIPIPSLRRKARHYFTASNTYV